MAVSSFPPPFFPTSYDNGGDAAASASVISSQQQKLQPSTPSTPTSLSVIIVIIVIASAIIVSATIYLFIKYLSGRFRRSGTFSVADDAVSSNNNVVCFTRSAANGGDLLESLPLFPFSSLAGGNMTGGDCAVCLSKFEPQDQLRLLPLCCHAFHAQCIDAWLSSNQTCPLCRSTVLPTEAEVMNKIREDIGEVNGGSFRIEIGSVSRRRGLSDSGRRSYPIGSFEYILDEGYEVSVGSTTSHRRGISDCTSADKDSVTPVPEPPGEVLAAEVSGSGRRNWLREYVDRVSSRTSSFRGSGRFFTSSSRRSETVFPVDDLEVGRAGEEISEIFRWLSGV